MKHSIFVYPKIGICSHRIHKRNNSRNSLMFVLHLKNRNNAFQMLHYNLSFEQEKLFILNASLGSQLWQATHSLLPTSWRTLKGFIKPPNEEQISWANMWNWETYQNTWIEYIPSEIVTGSIKACWDRGASKAGTILTIFNLPLCEVMEFNLFLASVLTSLLHATFRAILSKCINRSSR